MFGSHHHQDNVDGRHGNKDIKEEQWLGGNSVARLKANFSEQDIEMDSSGRRNERINTNTTHSTQNEPGSFEMTTLEKDWEFIMCSNDLDRVKQFLDAYPFREEPHEKERFVNYKSRINGFTALHYACQFCNVSLVMELIQNRGVDASIQSNLGMTPLHVLAQVRLDNKDDKDGAWTKKILVAQTLLLPSVRAKKPNVDKGEVLEPILTSPYVRDHFGRKACDLLPPEHIASMRVEFRAGIPDLPLNSKHKEKDTHHSVQNTAKGQMTSVENKISLFDRLRGKADDNTRSNPKHTDPNVVSTGMLSPAPRSLPVLNRSISTRHKKSSQVSYIPHPLRNSGPPSAVSGGASPSMGSKKKQADRVNSSPPSTSGGANSNLEDDVIPEE